MKIETLVVASGALLADLWGLVAPEIVAATFLPSIAGAGLHAWISYKHDTLRAKSVFITFAVAVGIGRWGGPWIADMAPASESALPIMCFLLSLSAEEARKFFWALLSKVKK